MYVTRYLDLFVHFVSLYNTIMKIFFIVASAGTVYLMAVKVRGGCVGSVRWIDAWVVLFSSARRTTRRMIRLFDMSSFW